MAEPRLPLDGKRALVIGAGTGSGRAVAIALAEAGADVAVAAATIDGDEVMAVRRTRRAVVALGRRSAEYAFDTTLGQNVLVSTRQVSKEMGGLDVLVNAQGAIFQAPAERTSDFDWARVLALNLGSVFFACRAVLREMSANGGVIINLVRRLPAGTQSPAAAYLTAQAGVIGLTRALASEYAARGIRVHAIELQEPEQAGDRSTGPSEVDRRAAALSVLLASDAMTAISGQVLQALPEPDSSGSVTAATGP